MTRRVHIFLAALVLLSVSLAAAAAQPGVEAPSLLSFWLLGTCMLSLVGGSALIFKLVWEI